MPPCCWNSRFGVVLLVISMIVGITVNNVDVDHGADGDPGAWPDSEDRVSWLGEGWLWMPYDGMW